MYLAASAMKESDVTCIFVTSISKYWTDLVPTVTCCTKLVLLSVSYRKSLRHYGFQGRLLPSIWHIYVVAPTAASPSIVQESAISEPVGDFVHFLCVRCLVGLFFPAFLLTLSHTNFVS